MTLDEARTCPTYEIATFALNGKLLVRVYRAGMIRRIAATRVAWAIAVGEWSDGVVRARNGVDDDLRFENLIVTKRGPRPFPMSAGGRASSLAERQARDAALLNALATHPDATVPQISRLVGLSAPCVCVRLAKLEREGLTCSPKCQAHIRWQLSQVGRELAASANPVVIDDLDRSILGALARTPMRQLQLGRAAGCCSLTAKRRLSALTQHGLVEARGGHYAVTNEGTAALGAGAPQRQPWVRREQISAASAKDVVSRSSVDDRPSAFRSNVASMGAQQGLAAMRLRRTGPFASSESERMAAG